MTNRQTKHVQFERPQIAEIRNKYTCVIVGTFMMSLKPSHMDGSSIVT